nr:mitochondrial genome maintenance protein [Cryptococcus depauperatus CBS 7841]
MYSYTINILRTPILALPKRSVSTSVSLLTDAAPITRYVRKATTTPTRTWRTATSQTSAPVRGASTPLPPPSAGRFPDDLPSSEPAIDDYAHLSAAPSAPVAPSFTTPSNSSLGLDSSSVVGENSSLETGGRIPGEASVGMDWSISFAGLSDKPFSKEIAGALLKPLTASDVEIKPDGLLYLPEIKYRRTLNAAFGPGGWGLAPRGETHVGPRIVSREWGLICLGRLVSVARGEQEYFDPSGIATATEACKSNALMRCCKDLGIASELWDPAFIRDFKKQYCVEIFVEHVTKKQKKKLWRKKNADKFEFPWRET